MRLMADTTDHSAPAGYDLYAGYIDGNYQSFPFLNAMYPGRTNGITVVGNVAPIADCESGDLTPASAARWVKYTMGATQYMLWVASYGVKTNPFPGAVAWQRQDVGPNGENIDVSEVYDPAWPYAGIPTIYCPASWAYTVINACGGLGLTFMPANPSSVVVSAENRFIKINAGNPVRPYRKAA